MLLKWILNIVNSLGAGRCELNLAKDWDQWRDFANTVMNFFFYVLLTVHLSIFILVINQIDAQNSFYSKFISCLYMFRAPSAHRQEVKNCIIQHQVSSHR